ncbi:FO synthase subunit 1 (7,8-didemethyl-8-hydroxy-5-deazariboflavin synthase) [Candidatus Nitrosocosmicus arcticus]|uniref:7,8-didemethyl-8-hydroxy-5-deazariboflavin synthase n=1 Tax=Candidatus Nitrosocosmicus arcticus TaxID=2035267 RepID=A0A557SYF3_9ARCH|nr:FO synthase subunit 1 (7,8-didemethyl-8-hydroxy-5-deazariboflavin synthase) [Candidatus Nitrosocosmicus arcticus]
MTVHGNQNHQYLSKKLYSNEIIYKIIEKKTIDNYELKDLLSTAEIKDLSILATFLRNRIDDKFVTYSRKVFINLINLCKDSCSYCTYKKEPTDAEAVMLSPSQAIAIAKLGKKARCTEVLIVTGERPEIKYQEAKRWLTVLGYKNLSELLADLSDKILSQTGMLPHTNAGSLTKKEMSMLKSTNASLGMMLESSSERLTDKGKAHEKAPSKNPKVRLKSLVSAGELNFPITTGLLIGIDESFDEVVESLLLINNINKNYGHIQEVIMQNFLPKKGTPMEYAKSPSYPYFLRCITAARIILEGISLQVPPNLSPDVYSNYLDAGINDWGGISPITPDYVNPESPWPTIENVSTVTRKKGFTLRARLPVYPKYIINSDLSRKFVHSDLKDYIEPLIDKYGLVKEEFINNEY